MRNMHKNFPALFEPHEWKVEEKKFDKESNKNNESIFMIGNGYIGMRGFFEEGFYAESDYCEPTTMVNGIYEYFDYHHIWRRPGFPERYHSIVAQSNPLDMQIRVDGEKVDMSGRISNYCRSLNLKNGSISRTYTFSAKNGIELNLSFERFALQQEKHLLSCRITISCNKNCIIEIDSALRSAKSRETSKEEIGGVNDKVFDFKSAGSCGQYQKVTYQTKRSGFDIICAVSDKLNYEAEISDKQEKEGTVKTYQIKCSKEKKIILERFAGFATNRDFDDFESRLLDKVLNARAEGFDRLLEFSGKELSEFWENSDITIDSDPLIQQGIRFSMLMIYQSTGKDGITNISANGLSGTGYSGHTFWDTEVFMMPMYIYTNPEIAKNLIMYRYSILDNARKRAFQMDDKGALFAWNSINGEECGHVFEAVTAQYHINADIFYAIYRYYEATEDKKFLYEYCAEILFEISKCLAHRGNFIENKDNKFCINVICGPDEYNPIVDNNMYTNVLTQKQLYFSLKVKDMLEKENPQKLTTLIAKCHLDNTEFELWKRAADNMYIPYSEKLQMYMQDDNFIYKDPIDIENIPKEKLPLLTNLHPLNLWRYQVCKQADIVLLAFICSDYFTNEERKKIFDYYEPKTIHDSSLSASIHSIVACDIGYTQDAYGYLKQAARMDLDNVNRNTFFGLHAACMGACWMMMVNGYARLRIYEGKLHFRPFCDEKWKNYSFKLKFKNSVIKTEVEKTKTIYRLLSGAPVTIEHYGQQYVVSQTISLSNEGAI